MPGCTATNEPRHVECGAPDFVITQGNVPIGYVEAKDVGTDLDKVTKSEQVARYVEGLSSLILTDYLEFRWIAGGEVRMKARVATLDKDGKLKPSKHGADLLEELTTQFMAFQGPCPANPRELAGRMAGYSRLIREGVRRALETDSKTSHLHQQIASFRYVLVGDLDEAQFADMYAQTLCYGLFTARCYHDLGKGRFTRRDAPYDLPKTNPFLRKFFETIAGTEIEDQPFCWAVDDLAEMLNRTDTGAILAEFGKRTKQDDPVVHFYETFLGEYDPKMRETRGVYYTPEPVVSYIVRSVDAILKRDFGLKDGLADATKVPGATLEEPEVHKVQILDPAAGTGTFLFKVIDLIRETFVGNEGMWPRYVAEHLLPRLYGFELLVAPYTVAHMKLGLQLLDSGYTFHSDERLNVYLTNTLEQAFTAQPGLPHTYWLVAEAAAAGRVKKDVPVMVILGNPPYSGHSANKGKWIHDLMRGQGEHLGQSSYFLCDGKPLGERNPKWLNDDYVKFIRFAQWRIERTGYGILAFVSNHGYLDNPTFRGMRQSLMRAFDDIYLLDLHGNTKKKEKAPDGGPDENVFEIQQGVAIGIFVKRGSGEKRVFHADLYGRREAKYEYLAAEDVTTTDWTTLSPGSTFYLFVPRDDALRQEYEQGWKLPDIFPVNSVGIVTARDSLTIHFAKADLWNTVLDFVGLPAEEARAKYRLGPDARDWKVHIAQKDLRDSGPSEDRIVPVLYRPFDVRWTYYTGRSRGFHCMPRGDVMRYMLAGENLGLVATRQTSVGDWVHVLAADHVVESCYVSNRTAEIGYLVPLWLDHEGARGLLREPNLSHDFLQSVYGALGGQHVPPEDIFHYIYAILHSPTYRSRYAEFLKLDFPRIPLTSNPDLWRALVPLGERLVGLHTMKQTAADPPLFPVKGDNKVEKVQYVRGAEAGKLWECASSLALSDAVQAPAESAEREQARALPNRVPNGRVYINKSQYFAPVPQAVWEHRIGGYQPCEKWLRDRKGRTLSYDDLQHYTAIVANLRETQQIMKQIDEVIEAHGAWPIQ
ncbi:MAG: hypothetical protein AMXMBFR61_03760 [Fimbriimonadales bacterium]